MIDQGTLLNYLEEHPPETPEDVTNIRQQQCPKYPYMECVENIYIAGNTLRNSAYALEVISRLWQV